MRRRAAGRERSVARAATERIARAGGAECASSERARRDGSGSVAAVSVADAAQAAEIVAIQQLIARFANSFDTKDWSALADCLAEELYTDYSDLRGTPAETISRSRFVALRRSALQALQTHHLCGNVEVGVAQDRAEAKVSMTIHRRAETGATFDTHCLYTFGLERIAQRWAIDSIVQKV